MKLRVNVCAGVAFAIAVSAFADSKVVPPDQVPPAVWKTLQAGSAGASPGKIERHDEHGEVTYDTTFVSKNGGQRSISVAQDGRLLSLEVTLADVPAAVRKTVLEQIGEGNIEGIDKQTDTDRISYEVDFTTTDGDERSLSVADDGTLLSREVFLEEAPAEVQKTIKARVAGGTVARIDKTFDAAEVTFDVDYTTKEGKEVSCNVAPDGRLLSVEVTMDDAPPLVKATITEKIGTGKVTGLRKVFGAKKQVVRYEVEAVVDGKPFAFKVGPKGKFGGADN